MIRNFRRHIAIIFILVFFYPTIYQSNHILHFPHQHHHKHKHERQDSHSGLAHYSKDCAEEDCPVCEFHYAVLHVDKNNPNDFSYEYIVIRNSILPDSPFIYYSGNNKLLRAPPVNNSLIS